MVMDQAAHHPSVKLTLSGEEPPLSRGVPRGERPCCVPDSCCSWSVVCPWPEPGGAGDPSRKRRRNALSEAPGEGERPELIDSSLAIELDNSRGGTTVRVGVAFALHGLFAVDDAIRLRLMGLVGVPWGNPSAVLSERAAAAVRA